jgi:hypothetical protein
MTYDEIKEVYEVEPLSDDKFLIELTGIITPYEEAERSFNVMASNVCPNGYTIVSDPGSLCSRTYLPTDGSLALHNDIGCIERIVRCENEMNAIIFPCQSEMT